MGSGQYLHVVVKQKGINVVVALFAPDGKKVTEANVEVASDAPEALSSILETTGAYSIEVRPAEKTAKQGRYEIKVEELRTATTEDKYRVAAELAFLEAERQANGTLDAKRKSLEKYNEALELYRKAGDPNGESKTLNYLGLIYMSMGETQQALEKFNEALQIKRAAGDRRWEAITLNNIGGVYMSMGETHKALETFNEALPIRRAAGDRDGVAVTLNNTGLIYYALGETQKALETLNEALPIRRDIGDRRGEAITLINIGLVYGSMGKTQEALEKSNEALSIFQALGLRYHVGPALTAIGGIYLSLGETRKALEKLNEALPICKEIGNRSAEASTLSFIGAAYHSMGESRKALEKFNEALPIRDAVGDRRGKAITLAGIGAVYHLLQETQEALEKFNEALTIFRTVSDRRGEASTLLGIARAEQSRGNLTQARNTIEQAVGIIESLRSTTTNQEFRASYLASRQDFYQSYIDILMQMHKQNPDAAFDAVAFAVSERARARSLLELLTEANADIRQGIDSALLERERSLQLRLNAKAAAQGRLLNRKHTPEQADAAAKELTSITTEHEELMAQIRANSPRYAALTQPQPLNLAEIQQQALDPETLLLEYSLGDNASYLFVVSQTSIISYQLPKRDEIEAAARRARELLTAPQPRPGETKAKRQARIKEAKANYWPQAAALSRILLGPAASQLGAKRLLIVPDGALQYLPFGALPAPEPERQGAGEAGKQGDKETRKQGEAGTRKIRNPQSAVRTPLIVEREIIHLPSASALAVLRRELAGRQPAAKAVAVLADPVFTADDARVKTSNKAQAGKEIPSDLTRAISDARGELRRLLMTRDEAETILLVTPRNGGLAALDFRASRATATGDELRDYRIVHFATHGLLNNEHPELSGLVLSLVDEQGRSQDGFLRMHEIFNLQLPAELVVLSACQTGLGKEVKGEGLVGLTRGFMYAGAARVMASLWEVNDVATAELMKRFYRRMLRDGMRPAAALRAAQIEMWKTPQWQSPFYWGAFVLQGEWK
ncbi:MAG TPA: CHAT domain-containing tetratricopeptide repeat protein [Blastocatellia bacterium]|nr:CHAT domain-containing tetratricopeptide repeat protein [Blastocatellia bacterium]